MAHHVSRILLLSIFSLLSLLSKTDAADKFDVDRYLALKDISEIALSPEGGMIAYTLTTNDLEKDDQKSVVWMIPSSGGEPVQMTSIESAASSPLWSPDGRYLAVLSDRKDETDQVWLLDRRGGDALALTEMPQGVDKFSWSPDSTSLLLIAEDPSPADLDKEELPNPRPWVIDRLQFKEDYVGYLDRHRSHIHIVDLETRKVRQITSGDFDDESAAWSPDGKQIVFVSNRTDDADRNRNTDLWRIDVNDENAEPRRLTENDVADDSPAWSPDGSSIVYTSTDANVPPIYALTQLTVLNLASGEATVIPGLKEVQVSEPRFTHDGKTILVIAEHRGEQQLVGVDVESRDVSKLLSGRDTVVEYAAAANNDIYALITRSHLPEEIFRVVGSEIEQLSFVNQPVLEGVELGDVEKFTFKSGDGTDLESFITFPPNHKKGRRYPGLLNIHGGPQAQYDYRFDFEAQLLAAQGYIVVMPNPRGSTGYGQEFVQAIYQDWGGIDYEDVVASVDHAIAEGWVHPDKTGVLGWSYGGMMTNHVITKTDRFKAAITGASATLYMANYGHDQYQRWWEEELGLPWLEENREKWNRISPFFKLDKVKTPTLIVGGEDDWNVPIHNSEQLYIALKRQGVPTELVVYPDQGHGFTVPSYNKDLYERYINWLSRWIKK